MCWLSSPKIVCLELELATFEPSTLNQKSATLGCFPEDKFIWAVKVILYAPAVSIFMWDDVPAPPKILTLLDSYVPFNIIGVAVSAATVWVVVL